MPVGAELKPLAGAAAAAAAMPGMAPTPGMTPPGGSTSKPVLRSRFLLGGGDSERDLSLSFLLLCLSLLLDLLRPSRLFAARTFARWQLKGLICNRHFHCSCTCLRGPVLQCLARQVERPTDHKSR